MFRLNTQLNAPLPLAKKPPPHLSFFSDTAKASKTISSIKAVKPSRGQIILNTLCVSVEDYKGLKGT